MVEDDNSRDCHDQDDLIGGGGRVRHQGEEAVIVADQKLVTVSGSPRVVSGQVFLTIVNPILQRPLGYQSAKV